jgi:hypothetical protein
MLYKVYKIPLHPLFQRGRFPYIPLFGKELAILQRGRESLKKAILLFANNSQLVKTNLKKGA